MTTTKKVIITCICFQVVAFGATIYIYNPQYFCIMVSCPLDAIKKIGGNNSNNKE